MRLDILFLMKFLIILLLISLPLSGQDPSSITGLEEGFVVINWEADPALYHFEIRKDSQVFFEKKLEETEIQMNLPLGKYEYRISVIDPFGNVVSVSEWQNLEVKQAQLPYFRITKPVMSWEETEEAELQIEGNTLIQETIFHLVKGTEEVPISGVKKDDTVTLKINLSTLSNGSWGLRAVNPPRKTFLAPDAVLIRPQTAPVLVESEIQVLGYTGLATIELRGEGFDQNMQIKLENAEGELSIVSYEVLDIKRAHIRINMEDSKPGTYSITLTNPSGEKFRGTDAVNIPSPSQIAQSEDGAKERENILFEFQAGYTPFITFVQNQSNSEIVPSLLALDIGIGINSGNTMPFLRAFGVEIHGLVGITGPSKTDNGNVSALLDAAFFWRPQLKSKVVPVVYLGMGNMWANITANAEQKNLLSIRLSLATNITGSKNFYQLGATMILSVDGSNLTPSVGLVFRRGLLM